VTKVLIVVLVIGAGAALWYFKPWESKTPATDTAAAGPPTEDFMRQCFAIMRKDIRKPGRVYCTCLWNKGVRVPSETLGKPLAQAAAAACEFDK
jgi:hypothetical protein